MEVFYQLLVNSVISFSLYALFGAGFTLLYGAYRFIDMSYASLAVIAAYVMIFFVTYTSVGLLMACIFGFIAALFIGQVIYWLIWAPLIKRRAKSLVCFLASLGLFTFFQAVLSLLFGVSFYTVDRPAWMNSIFHVFDGTFTGIQILLFIVAVFSFVAGSFVLFKTSFGRELRAVFDDEEVAKIIGIHTERVKAYAVLITSGFAALGGMLLALDIGMNPTMNLWIILSSVGPAIVGGLSTFFGAYVGAFIVGLAENLGIFWVSGEWKVSVAAFVLLFFLIFRPQGIFRR